MRLTKRCKKVLNSLAKLSPNNGTHYYTNDYVYNSGIDKLMSPQEFLDVLDVLDNELCIRWGDKQHSAFSITEYGRSYKELVRRDILSRWMERLFSFIAGAICAAIPQIIAWLVALWQWRQQAG